MSAAKCDYCGAIWQTDARTCANCGAPPSKATLKKLAQEDEVYVAARRLQATSSDYSYLNLGTTSMAVDSGGLYVIDYDESPEYDTLPPNDIGEPWFDKNGWYRTDSKPPEEPVKLFTRKPFLRVLMEKFGWL